MQCEPKDDNRAKEAAEPGKKEMQQAWQMALKLRKDVLEASATVAQILKSISEVPAWEWAKNGANQGKLQHAELDSKSKLTPFISRLMTEEPVNVKKAMGRAKLRIELAKLEGRSMLDALKELQRLCSVAKRRHTTED